MSPFGLYTNLNSTKKMFFMSFKWSLTRDVQRQKSHYYEDSTNQTINQKSPKFFNLHTETASRIFINSGPEWKFWLIILLLVTFSILYFAIFIDDEITRTKRFGFRLLVGIIIACKGWLLGGARSGLFFWKFLRIRNIRVSITRGISSF